jgi:hypothetical protein
MKASITFFKCALVCLAVALCSGCANQKAWVYRSNTYPAATASTNKKVAVLPFEDARENKNQNYWGVYLIPLAPYGSQNFDAPEGESTHIASGMWLNFKPTEDFPKALAEDLRNTHLFADAFFDYRQDSGDYVVKGKIISTKYVGRLISYGLSVYGPDLWLIGFPACWTRNDLSLELSLVDSKNDKVLFSKTYTATPRQGCAWIYDLKNDFNYSEMLAELNKQFCTEIQPALMAAPQGL